MNGITRIFDLPYHQLQNYSIPNSLVTKKNGNWINTSTQEYVDKSNTISRGLLRMGIGVNEKIAVITSNNRTEWHILDIGILQLGAQNVPVYPTISETDYEYILNHSEATYCFVSDQEIFDKLNSVKHNIPNLKAIFSFEEVNGCENWQKIYDLGEDKSNQPEVEERKNNVRTEHLATIIYTSGTTGRPKGVMLSHQNIVSNVLDCEKRIPFNAGKTVALSFLPICHIFERMVVYIYQF